MSLALPWPEPLLPCAGRLRYPVPRRDRVAFVLYTPGAPATQPKEASMRFTWFNLMPWPYLPDDFREKNRSVWVDLPNTLYDPKKGHFVYHTHNDQLGYAETRGL